jgi:hypothetical protein
MELDKKKALAVLLEEINGVTVMLDVQNRHKFCMEVDEVVKACPSFQAGFEFFSSFKNCRNRLLAG